jgi:hypothetical protein
MGPEKEWRESRPRGIDLRGNRKISQRICGPGEVLI